MYNLKYKQDQRGFAPAKVIINLTTHSRILHVVLHARQDMANISKHLFELIMTTQ